MISKWKAVLISSAALLSGAMPSPAAPASSNAEVIRSTGISGAKVISAQELRKGSCLRPGIQYSDSLLSLEVSRIDSLYFSRGYLAVEIEADTAASKEGIDVNLAVQEGEATRVGKVSLSGGEPIGREEAMKHLHPGEGQAFDPFVLERSLIELLGVFNESGYPFAQVWLTGFTYRHETNEVDISVSISEGERSRVGHVTFEGIVKTDSLVALRTSRLEPGSAYREQRVAAAREYLRTSGYFESIGDAKLVRRAGGTVDVIIPVKELERDNLFQGALGFSRKDGGKYILNGSVELGLRNIAGRGRNVHFSWLNDGENYSKLALAFREPFLFSKPVSVDGEITQVIQDTVYIWHSGGLYFGFPIAPAVSLIAGVAGDRNVPSGGDLVRSIRERFRLGVVREAASHSGAALSLEGAYEKNYLTQNRSENHGQLLYHFDGSLEAPALGAQSIYFRLVSEGVFSKGGISLAEMFPLGGANTLRGYRESQFRGEKIAFATIEYRFGEGGWIFLFDDVGAFYRLVDNWTVKNGAGFGLRSESSRGVVRLSFGVGERLSFEGARIHISLAQKF